MAEEARCSVCSAKALVRLDGTLRTHYLRGVRCNGSQKPPRRPVDEPSGEPDELMSIATLLEIGVRGALAQGAQTAEEISAALVSTYMDIRRIAAAAQDELDRARVAVRSAEKRANDHEEAVQRTYERQAERLRAHLESVQAASLELGVTADGFDPHGFFVYVLWGDQQDSRPLYVGQSTNLLARLGTHLGEAAKKDAVRKVTLIRCDTKAQMDDTETQLIIHYGPYWNIQGNRVNDIGGSALADGSGRR